ncbi:MAG: trehalose-6-phosphate synthase [Ferrimicrobium sp.]
MSSDLELATHKANLYAAADAHLEPIVVSALDHGLAYNEISNEVLWFLFHGIFDLTRRPSFDQRFTRAFEGYRRFNATIADAIADRDLTDTTVIVNDYHLLLLPGYLRERGVTGEISLFLHTPFPYQHEFDILPRTIAHELLGAMSAADRVGFHANEWEKNFQEVARAYDTAPTITFVAPLPLDRDGINERAHSVEVEAKKRDLVSWLNGLPLILRVDRIEPSKNLLRGVSAIDTLLENHAELRGRFRSLFLCYASRTSVLEYQTLTQDLVAAIKAINLRWGTDGWVPIHLDLADDPLRSLAAYQLFDALLVNPVRDGLNLVAAEGALLAKPGATIVLSTSTGIYEHLQNAVTGVSPFDVTATAEALADAIYQPGKLEHTREWITHWTWDRWFASLVGTAENQ